MKQSLRRVTVTATAVLTLAGALVTWGPTSASNAVIVSGATRTWVSGVGDDANPCSRTAPCKTLAGAISKTSAGGEINALDPGGFGSLTITKAITIDLTPQLGGVLVAGTNGITVNAGATDDVVLRGFDLFGGSMCGNASSTNEGLYGVRYLAGRSVTIEDSRIDAFSKAGVSVETSGSQLNLTLSGSIVRGNCGAGVKVIDAGGGGGASVSISNTTVSSNALPGIRIATGKAVVNNSTIVQNGTVGVSVGAADVSVIDSTISLNPTGVLSEPGGSAHLSRNLLSANGVGLSSTGGIIETFSDNTASGNGSDGTATATKSKL